MSKPVQLSEAALIGIHSLVLIANSKKKFLNVNEISERTGSSRNHIAKIMLTLVKAGFVSSVRGPSGGFSIVDNFENITLLSIFEAIEGKIVMRDCPFDKPICPFSKCLLNGKVHEITSNLVNYLESHTLKDLMKVDVKSLDND